MRASGLSISEIARRLGVHRKTVGNWKLDSDASITSSETSERIWTPDRLWPSDWDADELTVRTTWDHGYAGRFLLAIEGAQNSDSKYAIWFLRRLVEANSRCDLKQLPTTGTQRTWRTLIAAAPVLAEWLAEPSISSLETLILKHKPYASDLVSEFIEKDIGPVESLDVPRADTPGLSISGTIRKHDPSRPKRRQAYAGATQPIVAGIRERVASLAFETALGFDPDDRGGPYSALAELLRRLPMVDSVKFTRSLDQIFIDIFKYRPSDLYQAN